MTTQHFALTPREQTTKFILFFPLGVVVRFRAVFTGNITLRPYGQKLLKWFRSWDRKSLEHVVVIFWVVILGSHVDPGRPSTTEPRPPSVALRVRVWPGIDALLSFVQGELNGSQGRGMEHRST